MQLDDDYFGLVVGRLGSTVKKLHKNHKVQIKLGLYQEQKYIDSVLSDTELTVHVQCAACFSSVCICDIII